MIIRPRLRGATNADAKDIEELLHAAELIPNGHDWTDVGTSWIVAEYEGCVIGCIQVLPGKPFGFVGLCAVMDGYRNAGVGYLLARAAWKVLASAGCDGLVSMTSNEQILKKTPKMGGVVFGDPVSVIYKRVFRGK